MLEVFDASTASGSMMISSRAAKIFRLHGLVLDHRFDDELAVPQSDRSVVNVSLASVASRSLSASLPLLTMRSSEAVMRLRPR